MINLQTQAAQFSLKLEYLRAESWISAELSSCAEGYQHAAPDFRAVLELSAQPNGYAYRLEVEAEFDTRVRLALSVPECRGFFPILPSILFGDNHVDFAGPDEYPHLSSTREGHPFCSPLWEFRADRASMPVAILCHANGAIGISISPYSEQEAHRVALNDCGFIRNGIFAALPNTVGVSLGYGNYPGTFIDKKQLGAPTEHRFRKGSATGQILALQGDRRSAHRIMRALYNQHRECPAHERSYPEAAAALMDAFLNVSWGPCSSLAGREFYRNGAIPFDSDRVADGRPLIEIGWTAGGPQLYPFALAEHLLGLSASDYGFKPDAQALLDRIVKARNPKSGFFYELTEPWSLERPYFDQIALDPKSQNNGWWAGYIVGNQHSAYNNGSACYYILKTLSFWKNIGDPRGSDPVCHARWLEPVLSVLRQAVALQREDGRFGVAFNEHTPQVDFWDGFAGCWLAAACARAALFTGDAFFAKAAARALEHYHADVRNLDCYGCPLDTYHAVDQEGVLAFIRCAHDLHLVTGDPRHLEQLADGAEYEYLWRCGFRARPEHPPLKNSRWNSCGSSFTSVSNPHLHPMGLTVGQELQYLARLTGDAYHAQRAEDALAWALNTMELYPETTGVGRYGVFTERFCPSDGLVVEKDRDGGPYSIWRCFNGWAAAAVLEALGEAWLRRQRQ